MQDVESTIISQYGTSSIIGQLIASMNSALDPSANFDAFYDYVWNVTTAQGFGLDVWGRIVGIARAVNIPGANNFFGFQTPSGAWTGWNQDVFYLRSQGLAGVTTYTMTDAEYRLWILGKALANISTRSARSINQILQNVFSGRGTCYVQDLGGMEIQLRFGFVPQPYEEALLTGPGRLINPAGVGVSIETYSTATYLGFAEAGSGVEAFGHGVFYGG